jgi:hypothetical protein
LPLAEYHLKPGNIDRKRLAHASSLIIAEICCCSFSTIVAQTVGRQLMVLGEQMRNLLLRYRAFAAVDQSVEFASLLTSSGDHPVA